MGQQRVAGRRGERDGRARRRIGSGRTAGAERRPRGRGSVAGIAADDLDVDILASPDERFGEGAEEPVPPAWSGGLTDEDADLDDATLDDSESADDCFIASASQGQRGIRDISYYFLVLIGISVLIHVLFDKIKHIDS